MHLYVYEAWFAIAKIWKWPKGPMVSEWIRKIWCIYIHWGFPCGSEVKASTSNAGDPGSIPGSGRSPGEGNGNPLQYSCLENPMDRRAWQANSLWGCKESDMAEWLTLFTSCEQFPGVQVNSGIYLAFRGLCKPGWKQVFYSWNQPATRCEFGVWILSP